MDAAGIKAILGPHVHPDAAFLVDELALFAAGGREHVGPLWGRLSGVKALTDRMAIEAASDQAAKAREVIDNGNALAAEGVLVAQQALGINRQS